MKFKQLMIVSAFVEIGFGLILLLFPSQFVNLTGGVLSEGEGKIYAKLFGAALVSMGVLSWSFRDIEPSKVRDHVASTLMIYNTLASFVLLGGQLSQVRGPEGWVPVVLHTLLALAFAFFRFSNRQTT